MTHFCSVTGCGNQNNLKNSKKRNEENNHEKITFHLYPKNMYWKNKWLEALNLKGLKLDKTSTVCSAHFRNNDYEKTNTSHKKLKKNAVPHLFNMKDLERIQNTIKQKLSTNVTKISENIITNCKPPILENKTNCEVSIVENLEIIKTENVDNIETETLIVDNLGSIETDPINEEEYIVQETIYIDDKVDVDSDTMDVPSQSVSHEIHQLPSIIPDRLINSPAKLQLEKNYIRDIQLLQKKLCDSICNHKKAKIQIHKLSTVLKELQKLITIHCPDIFQHLSKNTKNFLKQ